MLRLLLANGYFIANIQMKGSSLTKYLLQGNTERGLKFRRIEATKSPTKCLEGKISSFKKIAKDIIQGIESKSRSTEIPRQVFKACPSGRTAEDVTSISDSAELVILLSLLWIAKNAESLIYFLKLLLGPLFFAWVAIRMVLHGQPSIGPL